MGNGINLDLQKPENFNAKKIAEKKVMGVKVIKADERKRIYEGSNKITDAQNDIDDAKYELTDADSDLTLGENEGEKSQKQGSDAEQHTAEHAATVENLDAMALEGQADYQGMEQHNTTIVDSGENIVAVKEESVKTLGEQIKVVDENDEKVNKINEEIDAIIEEIYAEEDTTGADSDVPADFDGTGSGTKSAYSLTTGGEIQTRAASAPASSGTSNTTSAPTSTGTPAGNVASTSSSKSSDKFAQLAAKTAEADILREVLGKSASDIVGTAAVASSADAIANESGTAIDEEATEKGEKYAKALEYATYAVEGEATPPDTNIYLILILEVGRL